MDTDIQLNKLRNFVGNTPVVAFDCQIDSRIVKIFAKYEAWNYTGSIKDRMALEILSSAYKIGQLKPNYTIVEATSGNTGIAFAAMGAFLGHSVEIYMPNWLSEERKRLLRFYGAKLFEISAKEGGFTKCIELADKKARKKAFLDQNSLIIRGMSWPMLKQPHQNWKKHFRTTIWAFWTLLLLEWALAAQLWAFTTIFRKKRTILRLFRYSQTRMRTESTELRALETVLYQKLWIYKHLALFYE